MAQMRTLTRRRTDENVSPRAREIPDQEGFKKQVLAAQIAEENKLNNFVSDRSTIDLWVLWQRWNLCQAMSYDTEALYNATYQQAKTYTAIIYVPPMFPPAEDGFRWTDLDYQKQIDRLVRMTLYDWQLLEKTCIVKALDTNKRLAEITEWLQVRS